MARNSKGGGCGAGAEQRPQECQRLGWGAAMHVRETYSLHGHRGGHVQGLRSKSCERPLVLHTKLPGPQHRAQCLTPVSAQ